MKHVMVMLDGYPSLDQLHLEVRLRIKQEYNPADYDDDSKLIDLIGKPNVENIIDAANAELAYIDEGSNSYASLLAGAWDDELTGEFVLIDDKGKVWGTSKADQ